MSPLRWSAVGALPVEIGQRWAAGRVWAARQAPYLASALLALEPVVVDGTPRAPSELGAFPVDGTWHIYLDPSRLAQTEVPTVGFWLVHQVSHLLRRHADRFPEAGTADARPSNVERSPQQCRWNMATDAEINDDISAGEIAVPEDALVPRHIFCPDGWVAEQYWDALGHQPLWQLEPRTGPEAGRSAPRTDCGSGCDGQPRPWDCGRSGLGKTGRKLVAREVAQRIREHCRARGELPAGWQRWADEVLEPTIAWQRVLSAAVRRGVADVAGRVDFSYRKPSRRAAATPGVVLPSLRQPLPQVAMVLDTSGSMSDQMLAQALAEVGGVLRGLGVGRRHLRVLCCDTTAYQAQRVLVARDVRLLGGGGTDMGAGLREAAALRP
ncbi:MAG TPA: VWA-like domain-containing protein, partial [Acidimicrobiales bacterium]|nr:VWA-like domain-containing protein [Acidimicrobiales bacterium]